MNWLDSSDQIIAVLVFGIWLAGFLILVAGRRLKNLDWVSLSVLGIFMVGITVDLFFMNRDMPGLQKIWARGWIGPRDQNGVITVGILEDTLGLTVALVTSTVGALFLANRWLIQKESNPERIHAGVLMGVAGVAVAWLSLTPWLSILGMTIVSIAGFVTLGARQDPELMTQFGRERTWGFILCFLGAAVLAGGRSALGMERSFVLAAQNLPRMFDVIGGVLLVLGILFQLQPFPFLGWLCRSPRVSSSASMIVGQAFSSLAAFGLAIRFEPELRSLGVFPAFEVLAMVSAFLTAVAGLTQESWKTALPLWISAMFSFAFGDLCFAGGATAFPILLGMIFSGCSLGLLACARESGLVRNRGLQWLKVLSILAIIPGLGFIGSVSSGGLARMMAEAAQDPVRAALYAFVLLAAHLLLFKNLFLIRSIPTKPAISDPLASLTPLFSAGLLLVLSLGLIWTGTLTGGALPHDPDRVFPSWLSVLFGSFADWGDESGVAAGEGFLWSALAFSAALSFWLFGRGQDLVVKGLRNSPKTKRFLQSGYSVDRIGASLVVGLKAAGEFIEKWISERLSNAWIPAIVARVLTASARVFNEMDQKVFTQEGSTLRQWIEVPAKALQLIQSGDLQWYLFFAIGCAAAILVHFLRV